jgi:hypothetical protein
MYHLEAINEYTYCLQIYGEYSAQLCQNIQHAIPSCHIEHVANIPSIYFSAEHVSPFKKYITEQMIRYPQLIEQLSAQLQNLIHSGYCLYGFDMNDLLVIDSVVIFCSAKYLLPIHDNAFVFTCPIDIPYFSSPEILELTYLPSKIHYKCCYYSLGALIVKLMLSEHIPTQTRIVTSVKRVTDNISDIDTILRPICNTKMYWFLKRCLSDKIEERDLLLI